MKHALLALVALVLTVTVAQADSLNVRLVGYYDTPGVAYGVAKRTREFGLRMALGSTPGQLKSLVIRSGIRTALIGLVAGITGAAALASGLRTLFYGVGPLDPEVMAGVAALLLTVALVANYVPARRATRIDPMEALHNE